MDTNSGDYQLSYPGPPYADPLYGLSGSMNSIFAGYNVDMGNWVYGAELSSSVSVNTSTTEPLRTEYLDSVTDVKARVGYEVGNALFYSVVGTSFGNFEYFSTMTAVSGISFGTGVDYLAGNFFVGIEYLSRTMNGVVLAPDEVEVNLNTISVRAGILF